MAPKVGLDTLPIEDLIRHVWEHWQDTKEILINALSELQQISKRVSNNKARALVLLSNPLTFYLDSSVPKMHKILSLKLGLWRQRSRRRKKQDEAEARKEICEFLADSETVRGDVTTALEIARKFR